VSKKNVIVAGILLLTLAATRCTKEVGKNPVKSTAINCDTITYNKHLQSIIEAKCTTGCHAPGGQIAGVPLTDYAKLKAKASDVDNHVFVIKDMPSGRVLTETERSILRCWLDNGNLE
jgi:uncharacterized membrane protein